LATSGSPPASVQFDPTGSNAVKREEFTLVSGATYRIIRGDDDHAFLAEHDVSLPWSVPLQLNMPDAASQHTLRGTSTSHTFDPAAYVTWPAVDLTLDTILLRDRHNMVTGMRVRYDAGVDEVGGPNVPIAGLVSGRDYYAIAVSPYLVALASTREDALAGRPINLNSKGSGSATAKHHLTRYEVDTVNHWIVSPSHELETGQAVEYVPEEGEAVGGLQTGQVYYAIRLDENTVRLAETLEIATEAARDPSRTDYVHFSSTGSGTLHVGDGFRRQPRAAGHRLGLGFDLDEAFVEDGNSSVVRRERRHADRRVERTVELLRDRARRRRIAAGHEP
jgi:hypothetical protein